MSLQEKLKRVLTTGKVEFGAKTAIEDIMSGNTKAVIVSKNCPKEIEADIKRYASLEDISVIIFDGTSMELGNFCGKPFLISTISVRNLGEVSLKDLKEAKK